MKQRSVLEFHILFGEASCEVLSRGGDQRRVMGSQRWTRDEVVAIAVETDLASYDFHLFGLLKDFLRGQYFTNNGELKTTVSLSSKNVDKELYRAEFQQCARRWEKCVLVNGNWEER